MTDLTERDRVVRQPRRIHRSRSGAPGSAIQPGVPKQFINPSNHHEPMSYSHAVKVGDTVYVAGQIAWGAQGNLVGPAAIESRDTYRSDRSRYL